jgi:hypothetical protein
MTFEEILDQAVAMLQRRGRIAYSALKRQFDLNDAYLEDLKDALLFAHPVVDADGRGLVWTGSPATPEINDRHWGEAEGRFQAALLAVIMMLQRDRRVTYRTFKHVFSLDDTLLAEIRKELSFRRLAIDESGEGLVWTGETPSSIPPGEVAPILQNTAATAAPMSPAPPSPQPRVAAADTTTSGPLVERFVNSHKVISVSCSSETGAVARTHRYGASPRTYNGLTKRSTSLPRGCICRATA